ncbi:hypothetical protein M231_04429 [Tremella mesenterica]|uniref:Small RNA 2'-O-methyltransferase n=1 Tax=Tremella mesenterica TaxID=5217 RepID=A0A4V1M3W2_TREME|nr:hypothetical protein M231_04429 [Tremella mesenterica]
MTSPAMKPVSATDASPQKLSPSALPATILPEVSIVEAEKEVGVTFTPELWLQRRSWAMDVLRKENIRSVLDIGCGPGALLELLVKPPSTINEPPIRPVPVKNESQFPSPENSEYDERDEGQELFLTRVAGIDNNPAVLSTALRALAPEVPVNGVSQSPPRWQPLTTELWAGDIERFNSHLEVFEAIVALEVIEHLQPHTLSRFGVVILGTYRPKVLLISTPNFDFNAKFPPKDGTTRSGFVDPTGRTNRVFRHSDHKLEMTDAEFREWAEASASDWGYDVEISGVGVSSKPSYYPVSADEPSSVRRPLYATQTAVFRLASGIPARSPRSVRTTELPFMPTSSDPTLYPHKLVARYTHPAVLPADQVHREDPPTIRDIVREKMEKWNVSVVTLTELWGNTAVSLASGGSKRWLITCLGGWGDVQGSGETGFEVRRERGKGFVVMWKNVKGD